MERGGWGYETHPSFLVQRKYNATMNLLQKSKLQNELTPLATDDPKGAALLAEEGMEDYTDLLVRAHKC